MSAVEDYCDKARSEGKKIGITNGCFDLLHKGHLYLLGECRKYCDVLVVAVNTDDSIKKLKGHGRPKETRKIRVDKLLSSKKADCITSFDTERELLEIIKELKPEVLIKGSDYRGMNITGAGYVQSYGGKVVLIPLLEGHSTTGQISSHLVGLS